MKKIYILFLISFFNLYFNQTSFHDTRGNIEVNAGGQLQYTLPIAVPSGIKSVAPQINLVYTSGSGNGIAGYGWNINGITAISRIGRDIERDGEIKKVQLDYSDFYILNGQRLILKSGTGTYGGNGAEYVTERYSNIKVKSIGSISGQLWKGPEYWEVTFEDGSQAWYGAIATGDNTARTPVEYNIVKWKDAQGNYITYNYTQSANVATISSIQWGGNETISKPHFNEIIFNYQTRNLKEVSYSNGVLFEQTRLLNSVQVKASGVQFKKYSIAYDTTNFNNDPTKIINYNYVKSVTEYNSNNEAATPVTFATSSLQTSTYEQSFGDFNDIVTSGDYNGDGRVDFLLKQPAQNGRPEGYYIYFDPINSTSPSYVYLGASTNSFFPKDNTLSFNIKSSDNIVKAKQGIVTVRNIAGSTPQTTGTIEIKYYSVKSDNSVLNTQNYPLVLEYSKTIVSSSYEFDESWYTIPNPDYDYLEETKKSSFATPKEIDIDSDGISELMISVADAKCYKKIIVSDPIKAIWTCENLGYRYLVVDNNDLTRNSQHIISSPTTKNILSKTSIMDFDNNGKQDIMFINTSTGNTNVTFYVKDNFSGTVQTKTYSTPVNNIDQYEITKATNIYSINKKNTFVTKGLTDGILYGDLNGDKNIEILMPIHEAVTNQPFFSGWSIYLNDGKSLSESVQGLTYYRKLTDSNKYEYNTAGLFDINNDGKSELVNSVAYFSANTEVGYWWLYNLREFKYDPSNTQFKWSYTYEKIYEGSRNKAIISPIIADFRVNNSYSKVSFILKEYNNNNALKLVSYKHYDLSSGKNITSITQAGLTTYVDYKELDPQVSPNFYAQTKSEQYPFMELDKVSQSYTVYQLKQGNRKQDFRYRGMITHLQGRGIIGFRQTAQSSWYADGYENTKVWVGTEIDPQKLGVPIKEWTVRTNDENLIFPSDISENNSQLLTFKKTNYSTIQKLKSGVEVLLPENTLEKDFLKSITTTNTITYGDYYLPNFTETKVNGNFATKTSELNYSHNPAGIGKDYFIGRPNWKKEIISVYGDTKQAKEVYTYNNNLLETVTKFDQNNTNWIKEKYYYDEESSQGFGNITKKETTNNIDTQVVTTQAQYESKGRFVIKKTDNLGLQTEITYNDLGQILTEKYPLGNTTINNYDNWGKLTSSISSLSGTTTYTYQKDSYNNYITTQYSPDSNISVKFVNVLGQNYKTLTKALEQNKYVSQEVRYDALGRKIYESDPYFSTDISPNYAGLAGNTITYDDTVFPAKVTVQAPFSGKKVETSIKGNTTTIAEKNGYQRTFTKTTDALGNIVSSSDSGGTITFNYNANGQQTKATYAENVVTTSYDEWGRKSAFNDPANGNYTYEYTGMGDIKKENSPKGYKKYTYKTNGLLDNVEEKSNDNTSTIKNYNYSYNQYWQVTGRSGSSNGKTYTTLYGYHPNGRLWGLTEYIENREFRNWDMAYDSYGNVKSYKKEIVSNGVTTSVQIENFYNNWDGSLYQIKEQGTGKVLWELQSTNAKGQVLNAKLGAAQIENTYSNNGYLSTAKHTSSLSTILNNYYMFDSVKNELVVRYNYVFGLNETFTYDNNNRLVSWTNPKTGQSSSNTYDEKGRITVNDQVGNVNFAIAGNIYRASKLNLNANGTANYGIGGTNILLQNITYNENNDPIKIRGRQNDYAFEYGLSNSRQIMNYGGKFEDSQNAQFTKIYSEDGSFQITRNNANGQEEHLIYIGGSPYESNIVYKKDYYSNTTRFLFLHKDYLGSILAVTDASGYAIEQRHYDAWGNFTHFKIAGSLSNPDTYTGTFLIDRGYTSHEHLLGVGLIHMNGRLYDPLLRRFLNADENIQDPFNTQNYNKYGYVFNNPMMYADPSGEFVWIIVGAVVGAYITGVQANGGNFNPFKWDWKATGGQIALGAVFGAISGGVGAAVGGAAATFAASSLGISGGVLGGAIAGMAGGAIGGAISGLGNSLIFGESIGRGIVRGMVGGAIGGAVLGGVMGGIQTGIANAKPGAIKSNIWDGTKVADGRSAWAFKNTPKVTKPTTVGKVGPAPKVEVGMPQGESIKNPPSDLYDRNPNLARELQMDYDGNWRYPGNDGAIQGTESTLVLKEGTYIDRFGQPSGRYASPVGESYGARSLPPGTYSDDYGVYRINQDILVQRSIVAPSFGQPGYGVQYKFSTSLEVLMKGNNPAISEISFGKLIK